MAGITSASVGKVKSNIDYTEGALALKLTESGSYTYIAKAAPGSSEASPVWMAYRLNSSTGLKIEYADGDSEFNNVATDLTALSYS